MDKLLFGSVSFSLVFYIDTQTGVHFSIPGTESKKKKIFFSSILLATKKKLMSVGG